MIETIVTNWWKVVVLLAAGVGAVWGVVFAIIKFLERAKASGVDEVEAGPVKVDFDDKDK